MICNEKKSKNAERTKRLFALSMIYQRRPPASDIPRDALEGYRISNRYDLKFTMFTALLPKCITEPCQKKVARVPLTSKFNCGRKLPDTMQVAARNRLKKFKISAVSTVLQPGQAVSAVPKARLLSTVPRALAATGITSAGAAAGTPFQGRQKTRLPGPAVEKP